MKAGYIINQWEQTSYEIVVVGEISCIPFQGVRLMKGFPGLLHWQPINYSMPIKIGTFYCFQNYLSNQEIPTFLMQRSK